jgi:sodium-dependent dicarboxylate transporter 2/3/5
MTEPSDPPWPAPQPPGPLARWGRVLGPVVGVVAVSIAHPESGSVGGLGADAAWTLGVLAWMVTWWITQATAMATAALLPVVLLPVLGVSAFRQASAHYADGVIFLFAGSTVLGLALARHGVTRWLVHALLRMAGTSPARAVAALFVAAAVASAFVSNTATAAMMLPMAAAVAGRATIGPGGSEASRRDLDMLAVLAVAYGATVGGGATLVGSPPNAIAARYLLDQGITMDFARWSAHGVPVAMAMAALGLPLLLQALPVRGVRLQPLAGRPPSLTWGGRLTVTVFACTVLAWITLPAWPDALRPEGLSDAGIAVVAAILLLVLPACDGSGDALVPWRQTRQLPWGVFILFGGGLAIADAMQRTGLSQALGSGLAGLADLPGPLLILALVTCLVLASEVASNTALAAAAIPIVGAMAVESGLAAEKLVVATAMAASYPFMLPVATPPNALAFATGRVPYGHMVRVGIRLDALAVIVVSLLVWWLA